MKIRLLSLLLFLPLIFIACQKGDSGNVPDTGSQVGTDGAGVAGDTGSKTVSCPEGMVGPEGNPAAAVTQEDLYGNYHQGTLGNFINSMTRLSPNEKYWAANMGNLVGLVNETSLIGKPVDLKGGKVLGLKLIQADGRVYLAAGTTADLQVLEVDLSSGIAAASRKVFGLAGGVSAVDYYDGNIYFTNLHGDFGYIPLASMLSQSGCGRILYQAPDSGQGGMEPDRAFRIAATSKGIYFLVRNNAGGSELNWNSILANLSDWYKIPNPDYKFLRRQTQLYRYDPVSDQTAQIQVGDGSFRYLMDDVTAGPGEKAYVSYWAPREKDIRDLQECLNAPGSPTPCPPSVSVPSGLNPPTKTHNWLAYMFNLRSGILEVDGTQTKDHPLSPVIIKDDGKDGCDAIEWAQGWSGSDCIRAPNLGMFFFNRVSGNDNAVIMRGIAGYARLSFAADGTAKLESIDFTTTASGISTAAPLDSISINDTDATGVAGYFSKCPGPGTCFFETTDFTGGPILTEAHAKDADFPSRTVLAGGAKRAYVREGGKIMGIDMAQIMDSVKYDEILDASNQAYPPKGAPLVFAGSDDISDHLITLNYNSANQKVIYGFYESESEAPVGQSAEIGYGYTNQNFPPFAPMAKIDNYLFVVINYEDAGLPKHAVYIHDLGGWPPNPNMPKKLVAGVPFDNQDGWVVAVMRAEKLTDSTYGLYLWKADTSNPLAGIQVHAFTSDGVDFTSANSSPVINTLDMSGFAGGGGKAYALAFNGDLKFFNPETGVEEASVSGVMPLSATQKVLSFQATYLDQGKLVFPVFTYDSSNKLRMESGLLVVDLQDNNHSTFSKFNPRMGAVRAYNDLTYTWGVTDGIQSYDFAKSPEPDAFTPGSLDLPGGEKADTNGVNDDDLNALNKDAQFGGAGCSLHKF